jgi:hypothetical protein
MKKLLVIFCFLWFIPVLLYGQNIRRYNRYLDDHKYEKLEEKLQKSLEKDSINASSNYVYSLLYDREDFSRKNLDTAYVYILEALKDYKQAEKGDLRKLERWEIDLDTLLEQKQHLDSLAFERALAENTEESYQRFLDKHPDAKQVLEATERRNELAFAKAQESNTYQAYKEFAEKYPLARQVKEAKGLYHFLLFEEETQNKDRQSYHRFLNAYPNNPYVNEAQKQLFEIITAPNTQEAYANFLNTYPQSPFRQKAVNMLYHYYLQKKNAQQFQQTYPELLTDSLRLSIRMADDLLIPVLEDSLYGFMNTSGKMIFAPAFDKISQDYLCEGVADDYFVAGDEQNPYIIAKNGSLIYSDPFDAVQDLGFGLLRIRNEQQYGLLHKAGYSVLDLTYENLEMLLETFISYKEAGKWGLKTLSGRTIFKPVYDSIYVEGKFVVLEQDDRLALTNKEQLIGATENEPVYLAFMYDEAEEYKQEYLVAYRGDEQTLLNLKLKPVIPLGDHEIYEWYGGWLLESQDNYQVYDNSMQPVTEDSVSKVDYNKNWLALKTPDRWLLLNRYDSAQLYHTTDSLRLLSEQYAILFKGDTTLALFNGKPAADISKQRMIRLLTIFGENLITEEDYLMITYENDKREVYNAQGEVIIKGKYEEIVPAGHQLLIVKQKGKEGLYTARGEELLAPKYDGIGKYRQGYVTVLQNGKFGLLDLKQNHLITPQYDSHLQVYNDSLFIASKDRRLGLVNAESKAITVFAFEEVLYWNDSTALVQEDGEWGLFHIFNNEYTYEAIEEMEIFRSLHDEVIIKVYRDEKYGILSSRKGELVPAAYDGVQNIGSMEVPLFFARIYIKEADFYVGIYYNMKGEIIRRQAFVVEEFERITCED